MVLRTVYDGLNPQAAIDAPRWRVLNSGQLTLESHWPIHIVEALKKMGHNPQVLGPDNIDFGCAQAVAMHSYHNDQAVYVGGSDPRRDGLAGVY
jgi:gamma-glutamyltranspeptidase/glutathione hydrolase